ncbi:MAG TPA: aspartate kinase, partial [Bacteroidota bacterium]|nr:aspartate kinase [Bacteroidota bacterium]
MKTLTMKFGGTSVGNAAAIQQAAGIVAEQSKKWDGVAVVVSAMSGITDLLMRGANTAADGDELTYKSVAGEIRSKHIEVINELVLESEQKELRATIEGFVNEFSTFCHGVCILGEVTPRAMDAIVSFGERMNARVIAAVLRKKGINSEAIDATELIVTDDAFQKAVPKLDATRDLVQENLVPMLNDHVVPIITGFIGATKAGLITTLGRGGSDYSAAIIGTSLDSAEVWIWTDVDGVMTSDPRMVKNARVIPVLSAGEISELAYFGAKV